MRSDPLTCCCSVGPVFVNQCDLPDPLTCSAAAAAHKRIASATCKRSHSSSSSASMKCVKSPSTKTTLCEVECTGKFKSCMDETDCSLRAAMARESWRICRFCSIIHHFCRGVVFQEAKHLRHRRSVDSFAPLHGSCSLHVSLRRLFAACCFPLHDM